MGILASEIVKKKNKTSDTAAQPTKTPQVVDALQVWLHPVDNFAEVGKHSRAYVQGTRKHFLTHVESLLTDASSSVLWLNEGAGAGKSVIAWLVSQNLPENHVLGSAFYCQHDVYNFTTRTYSAVIKKISPLASSFSSNSLTGTFSLLLLFA
ncbi:hypothetical protein HDU83_008710 [Entophlyctis luteolus]|nr:hypothetical protein HDU83_008710 [Entophlyctis luteolus]